MATILTKKSDTASSVPLVADLTNAAGGAELAVNTADKRLFTKTSGGSVVELGTNPSSITLPNGTANGIPYLNGSKVLTSGSALTFDGTASLGITASGGTPYASFNRGGGEYLNVGIDSTGAFYNTVTTNIHRWLLSGGATEAMRLTSTGLGIGTSNPSTKLSVVSSGETFTISGGGTGTQYQRFNTSGGNYYFGVSSSTGTGLLGGASAYSMCLVTESARDLNFGTNNTLRMTLDSSGNLGLGVTPSAWSADYKAFDLYFGAVASEWANYGQTMLSNNAFQSAASTSPVWKYKYNQPAALYLQDKNVHSWLTAPSGTAGSAITFTQAMTLDASGNLLVGTTSAQGRLTVRQDSTTGSPLFIVNAAVSGKFASFEGNGSIQGSITWSGSTTAYNTSSDYRLKNITGPITTSGAYIDSLNPVEGTWKADGSIFVGLIAHEVQEASRTQVATGVKDGEQMQAMDYSNSELIANLIAEVKSLRARVAALESN